VPEEVRLPPASGVPAVGRTRRFCHVNEQVTPPLLAEVTVKVRFVGVMAVIAAAVPLATPFRFNVFAPLPPARVMSTAGSAAFVSKMNPAGVLKMIVPAPTLPLSISV